jgi:ribonuclease E
MLIQVVKEERGNKGAALTSFLSLAGRYCVLMPNTGHGGGVSRKITNHQDRRRMKEILDQLEIPDGMAVILRTAGMEQEPQEIQRDLEYLLRLWDNIREQTLVSNAPALIYEEANLIKRSVRDLFTKDINEILVAGAEGFNRASEFMAALMPDQIEKIKLYTDPIPLFFRYHVENQIDKLHSPVVQLRSGGYIVINPTEALVAIDVNSGRATRERHIEETALKTNLEAADEVARQLRLRDLAGLIVIDFIDMEDGRNNAAVERRLKEAMKNDRARLQIGRISPFGLLELSRQRLRPSLLEINFEKCPHCASTGYVRSVDSAALSVLRAIEEEGIRQRGVDLTLNLSAKVALYILNQKRAALHEIEQRYDLHVLLNGDDTLVPPDYKLERSRTRAGSRKGAPAVDADQVLADTERALQVEPFQNAPLDDQDPGEEPETQAGPFENDSSGAPQEKDPPHRRFRRGGRSRQDRGPRQQTPSSDMPPFVAEGGTPESDPPAFTAGGEAPESSASFAGPDALTSEDPDSLQQRRRRRGRRGGRHRGNGPRDDRGGQNNQRGPRQRYGNAPRQGFEPGSGPAMEPGHIPASIHEIDTTPRVERSPAPSPQSGRAPAQERTGPSSYEVVNPPSDNPKGGWWRRLTGV